MTSHHRRGELGWNLETIGKLIIGVATLILIVYLSIKLVGIFVTGNDDMSTLHSLDYLESQVRWAKESGKPTSVIVKVYGDSAIIGFDAPETSLPLEGTSIVTTAYAAHTCPGYIERPQKLCERNKVCICAMRLSFVRDQSIYSPTIQTSETVCALPTAEPLRCFSVDTGRVSGTFVRSGPERTGANFNLMLDKSADPTNPGFTQTMAIFSETGPRNAQIRFVGNALLIDTSALAQTQTHISTTAQTSNSGDGTAGGY